MNYLALLGWNPGGDLEIFSMEELIETFSLEKVHKAGAIFSSEKLRWFNHEHSKRLSLQEYGRRLGTFITAKGKSLPEYLSKVLPFLQERFHTLAEAYEALFGEFDFIIRVADHRPPQVSLLLRGANVNAATARKHLEATNAILKKISPEHFTAPSVKDAVFPYAKREGKAAVLWPLRVALAGREQSPDPFALAELLGKKTVLSRVIRSIEILRDAS